MNNKLPRQNGEARSCKIDIINTSSTQRVQQTPEDIRELCEAREREEQAKYGIVSPAGEESARGFRLLSLAELLAAPSPPRWLVRGWIEEGALALLFGPSGSMKSFLALDIGLSIAAGLPWHGCTVTQGPVIYIAGEGFSGLPRRVQAWCRFQEVDREELPFFTGTSAVPLLDAVSVAKATAEISDIVDQHGTPRLLVLDTVARNFGPGDENSTKDMSAFVGAVDRLKARFGCAVLLVHHSGLQNKDRARGSSALLGALDVEMRLEERAGVRCLSCTKMKDHEEPPDMHLEHVTVGCGVHDPETGVEVESIVLRQTAPASSPGRTGKPLSGARKVALDALVALYDGEPVHLDAWRAEAYSRGIANSTEQDAKRKAFQRAVAKLHDSGHVETRDDHYWPSSTPGQAGHVRDMSGRVPGQDGTHPLRGVLSVPLSGAGSDGGEAA